MSRAIYRYKQFMAWIGKIWDWIDRRDIDKHLVSIAILYGTSRQVEWAMAFAAASPRPGLEVAAIIAAVTAPYAALQAAAIAFYFNARPKT